MKQIIQSLVKSCTMIFLLSYHIGQGHASTDNAKDTIVIIYWQISAQQLESQVVGVNFERNIILISVPDLCGQLSPVGIQVGDL